MEADKSVKYKGEYVLTKNGDADFGEIPNDISAQIRRQRGKIRLRIGEQRSDNTGYGEKHINRPNRLSQLRQNGFQNARDLVEEVAMGYDAIYEGGGTALLITKKDKLQKLIVIKLAASSSGDFYDVQTGYISRPDYLNNKKPLWKKPPSGILQEEEGRSPSGNSSPSAISGQPVNSLSSSTPEKSSGGRIADNKKTLSQITDPAERELFQLTEDEIATDAQSFNTWEEWRDAGEAGQSRTRTTITRGRQRLE
jgi:hypothetical protein